MSAILPAVIGIIGSAIDKVIPNKSEAEQLKAQITLAVINGEKSQLESATNIITAEAQGESWLQRNWRPLLMLWFAGLIGAHWLGYTPANLPEEQVIGLLDIVQVGVGGYVLGRTAEKVIKEYKKPV